MESSEAEIAKMISESSSSKTSNVGVEKPVIVRVKRKLHQSPLEALWIEINERPVKRPLLDFQKLSIDSSTSTTIAEEEPKVKRVLVQHLETVDSSEATVHFLNSYVVRSNSNPDASELLPPSHEASPENAPDSKFTASSKQRRRTLSTHNIHDRLLSNAKQHQQELAKSARFEQIWKYRNQSNQESSHHEALGEVCRVYDVLRVDKEEASKIQEKQEEMSREDQEALSKFLPLLRECIPDAAEEIESDFSRQTFKQDPVEEYVYDLYAVTENNDEAEASYPFPLVQLDDDDQCYDGPDDSDYETDDTNAENHPYNDYPEEESSNEEEKSKTSGSSDEEEKSETSGSESEETESETVRFGNMGGFDESEDHLFDDENISDDASNNTDDEDIDNTENWRWTNRK